MGIVDFIVYLEQEKKTSKNTVEAYKRDMIAFESFLADRGVTAITDASNADVAAYMMGLKEAGKSKATMNRKLSSIRACYRYLLKNGLVKVNPTEDIRSPRVERKELEYLTIEEVEKLLEAPDDSVKGLRDRAMLEVLYASGIRVSELLALKVNEVNLDIGYLMLNHHDDNERIIPLYSLAIQSLRNYLEESRPHLADNTKETTLFLNANGQPMTRQGFWKLLKGYTASAHIEKDITPKTLRHSFATHLLENGADINMVKDMMGHSSINSTRVYAKLLKNKYLSTYENCHPRAMKAGE